jgi:hypothetical protein
MRSYLSFDLISNWESDAAITLAKTWVERTLVGERVGFFTPFNTIEDIVEPD